MDTMGNDFYFGFSHSHHQEYYIFNRESHKPLFATGILGGGTTQLLPLYWAMKKNGCLGYIGDYTTQLYRDYNKPL